MLRESTLRKCNSKISIIVLNLCVSKNFLSDPHKGSNESSVSLKATYLVTKFSTN